MADNESLTSSLPPTGAGTRDLLDRARVVRLLCLDVDGVLTDAGMYYGPDGEVLKKFNTRDGMGIKRVREAGVHVALISTEQTDMIHARAAKLHIDDVFTGISDKRQPIEELCQRLGLTPGEVAHVGDDVNDLNALAYVGLPCAVLDAVPQVRAIAAYITSRRGGDAAVREVCELLIAAREGVATDDASLLRLVLA